MARNSCKLKESGHWTCYKMAARSTVGDSPFVFRISHDELVAYADELDRKNEKKNSKKINHGKYEEKDSKPKKFDRKTDVSKNASHSKAEMEESFGGKETKFNHEKDNEGLKKTKTEKRKDKRKSPSSKSRHNSSSNTEDDVDPKEKCPVTNSDQIGVNETGKATRKRRGNVSKATKADEDEKDIEKYELDLRARTGGVLKLSKEPSYTAEDSLKDEKPRGIIKLPEGFHINSHNASEEEGFTSDIPPRKRTSSMNDGSCRSSGLHGPAHTEKSVSPNKEVQFSTVNEKITVPPKKHSTSTGQSGDKHAEVNNVDSDKCVDIQNTSMENNVIYETKAEKTLKSINQQRAQRLLKVVAPKRVQLIHLLSRGTLDKAAFAKICSLSKEIQDTYKGIMMLDIGLATQLEIDQNLWKSAFYKVIETLRKYGKLFLGYEEKSDVLSPKEINNCLKEFLKDAETFYKSLLELLQKEHDFSIQDIVSQPRKAEKLGKNVSASNNFFSSWVLHFL